MNEQTEKIVNGALSWWNIVRPKDGFDRYNGERAELRRCHSIRDVVFLPSYHLLLDKCDANRNDIDELQSLAVIAWVLSWVNHESEMSFAEQLAKSDPQFQTIRFRRLLETTEPSDLGLQLIRALKFTKQGANIKNLIESIISWNHGSYIKEQWALNYYRFVKIEKTN